MADDAFELPFLAPIPRGHEVLVVGLLRAPTATEPSWLVVDRTAGILYCGENLWGPLGQSAEAASDPVAVLTRWSWRVARSATGRVRAALVASSDVGDSNFARTRLFLEPEGAGPYR